MLLLNGDMVEGALGCNARGANIASRWIIPKTDTLEIIC